MRCDLHSEWPTIKSASVTDLHFDISPAPIQPPTPSSSQPTPAQIENETSKGNDILKDTGRQIPSASNIHISHLPISNFQSHLNILQTRSNASPPSAPRTKSINSGISKQQTTGRKAHLLQKPFQSNRKRRRFLHPRSSRAASACICGYNLSLITRTEPHSRPGRFQRQSARV